MPDDDAGTCSGGLVAPAAAAATLAAGVAGHTYREDLLMLEKLLALFTPQEIKDRLAALEAWKAQVESVWPQIVKEVTNGTD
jgi:hypothetical protein